MRYYRKNFRKSKIMQAQLIKNQLLSKFPDTIGKVHHFFNLGFQGISLTCSK